MAIKVGSSDVTDVKIGSTDVQEVYEGSNLIWKRAGPIGEQIFTGSGNWLCPAGVTSVNVCCIGAGAGPTGLQSGSYQNGGSGGGLGWKNNIPVIPGNSYTVSVGVSATVASDSFFIDAVTVSGEGGNQQLNPGGFVGDGGGNGGLGGQAGQGTGGFWEGGGGGGAGGYSGNGGQGGQQKQSGQGGSGGSGGGGAGGRVDFNFAVPGGDGGGTGVVVSGANGTGGTVPSGDGGAGSGGSGLLYGAGGYGGRGQQGAFGGAGAVRIVWGDNRTYPNDST